MASAAPSLPPLMESGAASASNADGPTQPQQHQDQGQSQHQQPDSSRPLPPPLDTMRAYRACLNCRNRKSKCDLDANQGRPPCRRCQREGKECILGESHRGGRRVRKKPRLDHEDPTPDDPSSSLGFQTALQTPTTASNPGYSSSGAVNANYSPHSTRHAPQPPQPIHDQYDNRQEPAYGWHQQPTPTNTTRSDSTGASRNATEQANLLNQPTDPSFLHRAGSSASILTKSGERTTVQENIASADLQNPSDALDILAQVADRVDEGDSSASDQNQGLSKQKHIRPISHLQGPNHSKVDDQFHYKPVQDGSLSPEMIYHLFSSYEEYFHPFFPIIPRETFDRTRLPWLSRHEPHLFSAILTVASKDNERVHQVCYDHNQQLISMLLAGTDANVEAVEALLLLSQWVSHRPQASIAVGRGEEDRVAWMYIGTALRLGYFLGIDRTSFRNDSGEDPAVYNRKRLVWSACYICDRQVSVRLGKGFWARGPGPLSGLKSSDFPTLQPLLPNLDNWALIFQANLELTQIFGNVHDILYSSKGHGWKEMLEGRYAKYLDDFRTSIRSWNDIWGTLICSPRLKASLLLTYDYLRLYVNAFAYQATISRALTFQRDSQHTPNRPMPLINASAPDARFIYEALDAAKSLLSTFNNFVDPETLRYMPSSYYLFIIYSAVFLYKARSTTTMTEEERTGVRHMINQTIERLQKASVGANHMGSRYARLLQLLWRKAPKRNTDRNGQHPYGMDGRLNLGQNSSNNPQHSGFDPHGTGNFSENMGMANAGGNEQFQSRPSGAFSWLDLGATWNFATQNNTLAGSTGDSDNEIMLESGLSPFEMGDFGAFTDYSLLEGDNPNLIF
ncbi:uncharacterized protein BP5553_05401 [Venustampulla echinocandica]|uniref:Zn(2)-C6 fungal-type domain-containing protein n=1 Tax=Venustampulla echinocandica TaxID=2656787 RepID=A0A370TR31_9HELO|nr:uncharacterized protein BP5553_05401 [Venustampulla echinocandica]RDL37968.1 hypothetical protein BP5553_05401 [Venustampulla echinocandica]